MKLCSEVTAEVIRRDDRAAALITVTKFFRELPFRPAGEQTTWGEVAQVFGCLGVLGAHKEAARSGHQVTVDELGNKHHGVTLSEDVKIVDQC